MGNNLRLDPELTELVARARKQAAASGQLTPARPSGTEPLSPDAQQVLRDWIDSGEFATAVAAVAAEDPDLATEQFEAAGVAVVVDDHLLVDVLAGKARSMLGTLAERAGLHYGLWLYRLARAAGASGRLTG